MINVTTNGNGTLSGVDTNLSLGRSTILPGQNTPVTTAIAVVDVNDRAINNPPGGNIYSRAATITWVDTPPADVSTYSWNAGIISGVNVNSVSFSDRALNAIVFPIGSALS